MTLFFDFIVHSIGCEIDFTRLKNSSIIKENLFEKNGSFLRKSPKTMLEFPIPKAKIRQMSFYGAKT